MLHLDPLFKKIDRNFQSTSSSSNTTADSIEIAKKTSEVESIIDLKEAHSKKGIGLSKRDKKYEKKISTRVSLCKV